MVGYAWDFRTPLLAFKRMLCNYFQTCHFTKEIKKIFDFQNYIGGRVVNRCYILSDALWQKGKSLLCKGNNYGK